jgi:hypothetical protein
MYQSHVAVIVAVAVMQLMSVYCVSLQFVCTHVCLSCCGTSVRLLLWLWQSPKAFQTHSAKKCCRVTGPELVLHIRIFDVTKNVGLQHKALATQFVSSHMLHVLWVHLAGVSAVVVTGHLRQSTLPTVVLHRKQT